MSMPINIKQEIKEIISALKKKRGSGLLRDALVIGTGSTGAQLLTFLMTPLITRMFSVSNFGVMTTFTAVALTCAVFGNGSYDQAINVPKENRKAWDIFCLCLVMASIYFTTILLLTFIFEERITQLIFGVNRNWLVYLLPLTVYAHCIHLAMLFWTIRMKGFKTLSGAAFLGTAGNQGTKILGGWTLGDKLGPLITGSFLTTLLPCFLLGGQIYRTRQKEIIHLPEKKDLWNVMIEYRKFPLYATWVEFLINLGRNITIILMAAVYDIKIVGLYGLAHNVLRLPVFIIGDSIRQVCLPRFAALIHDQMPIRGLFVKILLGLAMLAIIPLAVIAAFGPQLFSFVFGQNWVEAGEYARIISPWLVMMVFLPPASAILVLMQKQKFRLGFNLVMTGFQIVFLLTARIMSMDIYMMLMILSIGSSIIYACKIYFTFKIIGRHDKNCLSLPVI